MEFTLLYGAQKTTEAMRAGIARHIKLEEEVVYYLSNPDYLNSYFGHLILLICTSHLRIGIVLNLSQLIFNMNFNLTKNSD